MSGGGVITLGPEWVKAFEYRDHAEWVNKAHSWMRSLLDRKRVCVDAKGRRCDIGKDFARARDEGAFPVSVWVYRPKERVS